MVHKKFERYIKSWKAYKEGFTEVAVFLRLTPTIILGVYAINNDYPLQEKEAFEENHTKVLDEIPDSHEIICGGYLNTMVGKHVQPKVS